MRVEDLHGTCMGNTMDPPYAYTEMQLFSAQVQRQCKYNGKYKSLTKVHVKFDGGPSAAYPPLRLLVRGDRSVPRLLGSDGASSTHGTTVSRFKESLSIVPV